MNTVPSPRQDIAADIERHLRSLETEQGAAPVDDVVAEARALTLSLLVRADNAMALELLSQAEHDPTSFRERVRQPKVREVAQSLSSCLFVALGAGHELNTRLSNLLGNLYSRSFKA